MVSDTVIELVFKAFTCTRRTTVLWNVWFALVMLAKHQARVLDLTAIAISLDISRETVRRSLRVLTKLGLIQSVRSEEGRPFEAVHVRSRLGSEETALLRALAARSIEIDVGNTAIVDLAAGNSVDLTRAAAPPRSAGDSPARGGVLPAGGAHRHGG